MVYDLCDFGLSWKLPRLERRTSYKIFLCEMNLQLEKFTTLHWMSSEFSRFLNRYYHDFLGMIYNFKLQKLSMIPGPFRRPRGLLCERRPGGSPYRKKAATLSFFLADQHSLLYIPLVHIVRGFLFLLLITWESPTGATHCVCFQFDGWHCASTTSVNCKEQTMNPCTLETNCNPRHLILQQMLKECHRSTRSVVLSAMIGGPE